MQLSAFVNFTLLLGEDVKHSSYHQHQRHPPFAFWCSSSDPTSSRVAYIQAGQGLLPRAGTLAPPFQGPRASVRTVVPGDVHSDALVRRRCAFWGPITATLFYRSIVQFVDPKGASAQPMTILALIIGYRPAEKSRAASTSSVDRNSSLFGVSDSRPVHSPLGGSFSVATAARDQRRSQHAERRPYCFFPSRLASAADAFRPFSTDPPARDEPETPSTQP
ncbi:unnamed protein product [Tilletia laevis]|uniref:Uncharacterized protein n=1 Tax=Tilletia laevis TaxID=157183 RepID=A0A9N8LP86_9BASI|nr:unnamed protein product [Tilletia laevis]